MRRDSFSGQRILWRGRPQLVTASLGLRLSALVLGIVAAVSTCFAIVVATALHAPVGQLLGFAAFCATLALALGYGPSIWRSELRYLVTEDQIIYQRGRIRRAMLRDSISYARIHWHPKLHGVGDLVLVRAVPSGALRRSLTLTLPAVEAPDHVWALIRGAPPPEPQDGHLLVAQRLEEGERVLWSASPVVGLGDYVPKDPRSLATLALSILMGAALVRQLLVLVPVTRQVLDVGVPAGSLTFVALMAAFALASSLLSGAALGLGYYAVVRPARCLRKTRYFVTDRRVLIQRGHEELSLARSRIAEVIDVARRWGGHDIFLVLDGPRARALATSGAFGIRQRKDSLVPVLHSITDAELLNRLLREVEPPEVLEKHA